uniref:uncharacterized protein LOC117604356 n=1 Tax=Osmia lignaria TaxID=473952 RepID=UPI001478CAB9|nr:uncharacterized protein LOC117604356 [Osmia lignaria]
MGRHVGCIEKIYDPREKESNNGPYLSSGSANHKRHRGKSQHDCPSDYSCRFTLRIPTREEAIHSREKFFQEEKQRNSPTGLRFLFTDGRDYSFRRNLHPPSELFLTRLCIYYPES